MNSGKPFAISLVLIFAYGTLMTTTPPMSADTDPAAIIVVEDASVQLPDNPLVMQTDTGRNEPAQSGTTQNATASAR